MKLSKGGDSWSFYYKLINFQFFINRSPFTIVFSFYCLLNYCSFQYLLLNWYSTFDYSNSDYSAKEIG